MSANEYAIRELEVLERLGRRRRRREVDSPQGVRVKLDGVEVVNFSSNDYLGLANHPALKHAAIAAIERWGVGAGASRLVVGNCVAHEELEAELAAWLRRPAARLFNSGYAANTGIIPVLVGREDVVFSDELNHASIIDGCRASRARVEVFAHGDLAALDEGLARAPERRRLVISETVFSMDGDRADVDRLATIADARGAMLMLDEAHAIGALGEGGRGLSRAEQADVVVGTLGKALGAFGAFAACSVAVAELLWNRARSLVFSTGLPPAVAAAGTAAVRLTQSPEGEGRRARLASRIQSLSDVIGESGISTPIAPVIAGDDHLVMRWTDTLLARGLFVQGIRPPTVPAGTARLRITLSADHSEPEVLALANEIKLLRDVPRGTSKVGR